MKREQLTEKILDIKRTNGWTWKYICEQIGGFRGVATGWKLSGAGGGGYLVIVSETPIQQALRPIARRSLA